jgi:hypothetical protein
MVTGGVNIQAVAMLTDTFGYAEIWDLDAVFQGTFEIVIDIHFKFLFVLLRVGLDLEEAMMRGGHSFLADPALIFPSACMSF